MTRTVRVTNAKELKAAITGATVDTKIVLASGNYGHLDLGEFTKASERSLTDSSHLTIVSENPNKMASFSSMWLMHSKNITIDSVKFDYNFTSADAKNLSARPFWILNSENVEIVNSVFDGDHAFGAGSLNNGYGAGTALVVDESDDVMISDSVISNFHRGIVAIETNDLKIKDNEVTDMSSDGLAFTGVSNLVIEGNYIHDFDAHPNTTAHKDFIQFRNNGVDVGNRNVVVRDNILDIGKGQPAQSIFLGTSETKSALRHKNFTIENNLIRNAHKNAISVSFADDVDILNNTILFNDDVAGSSKVYIPTINIISGSRDVLVQNNATHKIGGGANFTDRNNIIIQRDDPSGANYYGDLFVNALADSRASLSDLVAISGSVIDRKGVGVDYSDLGITGSGQSTTTAKSAASLTATARSKATVQPPEAEPEPASSQQASTNTTNKTTTTASSQSSDGTGRADKLTTGGSNDVINSYGGNDTVKAGSGADSVYAGNGNDRVDGGFGNDIIYGQNGADRLIGGGGNDYVYGGYGNDYVNGGDGRDIVFGQNGADRLIGGGGNDTLNGGADNDIIYGQAGADELIGGGGADRLYGEHGNDRIYGGNGNDIVDGGARNDLLHGQNGADKITGGAGADTIFGGSGSDRLNGSGSNDKLFGDAGDDFLFGGSGNDTLDGGAGRDKMTGNGGRDTFDINKGFGTAVITDFSDRDDRIDLSAFNFNSVNAALKTAKQSGSDTVFNLNGSRLVVEDFRVRAFDNDDFVL